MNLRGVGSRLIRVWREAGTDAETHWRGFLDWQDELVERGFDVRGRDVLEIGTGDRAQMSLLFARAGANVTGLDILPVALGRNRARMWWRMWQEDGLRAAAKVVVRDVLHTFRYWSRLSAVAGTPLPMSRIRLVRGDAARLPFPDRSFDLVVSSAVWEHLLDVPGATRELRRVLRPDGIAIIQIALFPALQGGHHAEWHSVDPGIPRTVRPWDHLLPDHVPFPAVLNEWSEDDYREAFSSSFARIEWHDGDIRGIEHLPHADPAIREMRSERDLTLSSVTAWIRRSLIEDEAL
jgi:SAM-dependent methyltransferase